MELLLKFIALAYVPYNAKKDIGDYLDDVSEYMLTKEPFPFTEVEDTFRRTFDALNNLLGEKSFKKFDGADFKGKFLESAFEIVAVGLAKNINQYTFPVDAEILIGKIREIYLQQAYIDNAGSGSNAKSRIPKLVQFGQEFLKK